jgi:FkbM family methyltransferase
MNIECPATMRRHVQKFLGGEYDIPYRHNAPVILDIGANIGSFAAWALKRWPGCHVHCYEPLPDNFALLKRNLGQFKGRSVSLHNFAVGDPSLTRLYLGRNNCGEASFYDIGEQTTATIEVETRAPDVLPTRREDRHRRF